MSNKVYLDKGKLANKIEGTHDYEFPSSNSLFSIPANLIPAKSGVSGGRILLGSKAFLQAIGLIHREPPLVHSAASPDDESINNIMGKNLFAQKAQIDGTVTHITDHEIKIKPTKGHEVVHEIYNNYPLGRKSGLHNTPIVKVGDKVKENQVIATSNYTDSHGNMALGVNLRTAIMPFRSGNFEDAYVVSESGAKKLEAEQLVTCRLEEKMGVEADKNKYISLFPNKFLNSQLAHIDSDGVVKQGSILKHGDPVIIAVSPKTLKATDIQLGKLSKLLRNSFRDNSQVWEYEHDGEVVNVSKAGDLITVLVKTKRGLSVGDKISVAFGSKGVLGSIKADSEVPQDKDGKPVDVILNSMSVTSRVAPALMNVLGLGKVAQKIGKPITVPHFMDRSLLDHTIELMKKHGVTDTETLYDPTTGQHMEVVVGPLNISRLTHIAEDKESSRSQGAGYCFDSETEVLTKRGWVSWPEINDNDLFFTTSDFKEGRYEKPDEIIRQRYVGKMYGFHGKMVEYLVTPNHNFVVIDENNNKLKVIEAKDFHNKRGSFIKSGVKLPDKKINDIVIPTVDTKGKRFDSITISSFDFAKFLGIWISEGSVRFDEEESRYRVYVWQDQGANPVKFKKIQKILDKLPFKWHIHVATSGIKKGFYTSHAGLAKYLIANVGKYCKNKSIPDLFVNSTQRHRLLILKYLIMGDGSKYPFGYTYATCSKVLADSVQRICTLSGLYASVHMYKYEKNINDQYVVTITKTKNHYIRNQKNDKYKNFFTSDYDGIVYCARIDKTNLVYVKRNGKCFWSHNSIDGQPTKTPEESAKKISNQATMALLSHGASAVLKDMSIIKSTKNDEYWRMVKLGLPAPSPGIPFIFNKFVASLQGAGINVSKKGDIFQILPMTDKDITQLSQGPINSPLTFKVKHDILIPEAGGLFDVSKVGILGDKFNHVDLNMPIPNPISEDYLRKLLDVTKVQYEKLVTSGEIGNRLNTISVDPEIKKYKAYLKSGKRAERDDAVKLLAFLNTLKKNHMEPKDLMITKVPIIPAQFRPMLAQGDRLIAAEVNNLYKDLIINNNALKDTKDVPEEIQQKLKKFQYDAVKAVFGLGDPITTKNSEKGIRGLLSSTLGVKGGSAKSSMFQSRVVNKPIELVGRGVVVPDAKLNIDDASVPHEMLWKAYTPFIIRRMVQKGVPSTKAHEYLKNRNPLASQALLEELKTRPAIISREPALHKFNLMGFYLKPNADQKDKTIKINPLVVKGFAADFDGDQMNINVPASDEASQEVKDKMLPSKNLIHPKNFKPIMMPSNEAALGLYQASTEDNKNEPRKYKTEDDVIKDFNAGKISVGDRVEIAG